MRAIWNNQTLAESDDTIVVEGNHNFPLDSLEKEHFQPSATHTTCPRQGQASYYDVIVDGQINKDAAWYYPDPKPSASQSKNYVAFWRGVRVVENAD